MVGHMKHTTIKALPIYLQPKILSAVAYVNEVAPNLNKVSYERANITVDLIAKVIKELEHVFDVLKSAIYINRQRIVELEKRIKEIEDNT